MRKITYTVCPMSKSSLLLVQRAWEHACNLVEAEESQIQGCCGLQSGRVSQDKTWTSSMGFSVFNSRGGFSFLKAQTQNVHVQCLTCFRFSTDRTMLCASKNIFLVYVLILLLFTNFISYIDFRGLSHHPKIDWALVNSLCCHTAMKASHEAS